MSRTPRATASVSDPISRVQRIVDAVPEEAEAEVVPEEESERLAGAGSRSAGAGREESGSAASAARERRGREPRGVRTPDGDGRSGAGGGERSDQELLEGIRAASDSHFAELYDRYFSRIYNFVYARMRNHAETEEVVQETFLAVFRSFENYRGQSSLLSWIYGIAKNTTNNTLRRAASQSERIERAGEETLAPRPSLGLVDPEEQLDLARFQDQLGHRLDKLADWQTEIFALRHLEDLSIPEISRRTTRSSDAVRSSLYRVKRLFFEAAEASPATGGDSR